ncbi:MAG: hypothetical protein ISR58_00725 [Anaerolineales bacterium]|nr:hypothetical protein [Chloroflexota bacterium]MBL6979687.1 hypothetical protein [Anaerolineales bacterium]
MSTPSPSTTFLNTASSESGLLRKALLGNSIFSTISGLLFVFAATPIAAFLGLSSPLVLRIVGAGLLFFAFVVYKTATFKPVNLQVAMGIVFGDLLWVIGSVVLIFTSLVAFTAAGKWAIAIVADIVLAFAIVQYLGIQKARSAK